MATVPYRLESQEDLDDQDSGYPDPLAVADTPYSDVARAEAESEQATIDDSSELNVPNRRRLNLGKKRSRRKSLHKISDVRQRQGVTLRNVARRLGMETPIMVAGPVGQQAARAAGVVSDAVVLDEQWHHFNTTTDCT